MTDVDPQAGRAAAMIGMSTNPSLRDDRLTDVVVEIICDFIVFIKLAIFESW